MSVAPDPYAQEGKVSHLSPPTVNMLFIRSLELTHFITASLYTLTNVFPVLSLPQPLATTLLLTASINMTTLDSKYK